MILTDQDILQRVNSGHITVHPRFEEKRLGSNSYDFTLGGNLITYDAEILDCKEDNSYIIHKIPEEGFVLNPSVLYLGNTNERIDCNGLCPQLEGKSSIARLGICVHLTAGFGDIGFNGYWTLEITCVQPVRIYKDMPIAQIYFLLPLGKCGNPYNKKKDAKYNTQHEIAAPVSSKMFKNFPKKASSIWD